jgi:hypothetical protein
MTLNTPSFSVTVHYKGAAACDFAHGDQEDHEARHRIERKGGGTYHVCNDEGCQRRLRERVGFVYLGGEGRPQIEHGRSTPERLRAFVDGDMIAVVGPDFVNLQESDVVAWIPASPAPIPTTVAESLARVLARAYCDGSSVSHTSYPADEDQVNEEMRISHKKWLAIATAFLTGKAA